MSPFQWQGLPVLSFAHFFLTVSMMSAVAHSGRGCRCPASSSASSLLARPAVPSQHRTWISSFSREFAGSREFDEARCDSWRRHQGQCTRHERWIRGRGPALRCVLVCARKTFTKGQVNFQPLDYSILDRVDNLFGAAHEGTLDRVEHLFGAAHEGILDRVEHLFGAAHEGVLDRVEECPLQFAGQN